MLSLHTNAAALSTQNSLASTNKALTSSMTKLGTGFRVNSAMDDAAGLQVATRLNAQSRGMSVAQKNTQNGISMLQTAEGALGEVNNILMRMKDLATESASATSSQKDRDAMQSEFDALGAEMANIVVNTSFGGAALFVANKAGIATAAGVLGAAAGATFQIGASAAEKMTVTFGGATGTADGTLTDALANLASVSKEFAAAPAAGAGTEIATLAGANGMITTINNAVASVGSLRSALGAGANRLEHIYNNLGNMRQNTDAAKGRILDTDYALETANMTNKQMLMQASSAMLKQSSSMSQMVASLLQ
ncbi:lateral flagellin LafA [Melaminivora sp.]